MTDDKDQDPSQMPMGLRHMVVVACIALAGILLIVVLSGPERISSEAIAEHRFNRRFGSSESIAEISPAGYEALRDFVAANPSAAHLASDAFSDGRIDTREMRAIVGDDAPEPAPTPMTLTQAKADLAETVNAKLSPAAPAMDDVTEDGARPANGEVVQ